MSLGDVISATKLTSQGGCGMRSECRGCGRLQRTFRLQSPSPYFLLQWPLCWTFCHQSWGPMGWGGGGVRCAGMCKPTGLRRRQRVRRDWRFLKTHVRPTVRSQDGAVSPQGPFPPLALTDWGPLGSQASWGTLTFRLGCFFRCTGQAKTGNPFQLISSYHHLLK